MKRVSGTGPEVGTGLPIEAVTADMCATRDALNLMLVELKQIKDLIHDSVEEARVNTAALVESTTTLAEAAEALKVAIERSG